MLSQHYVRSLRKMQPTKPSKTKCWSPLDPSSTSSTPTLLNRALFVRYTKGQKTRHDVVVDCPPRDTPELCAAAK